MVGKTQIPSFLYGTAWKEADTQRCVEAALEAGFLGIDTANQRKHYFEAGVGAALKKEISAGRVARQDLFLQTKFTSRDGQDHRLPYDPDAPFPTQVRQSFESSLEHLHVDFLDSYILHGPTTSKGLIPADWEIWGAMEELHHEKKVRFLGISNVNLEQLRALYENARIKPTFVQNRCFARRAWDKEIRTFCRKHQIVYQGFSLLTANPEIFQNPRFIQIVDRVGCTPAQAVYCFAQQVGMLPLNGTTDPVHMSEDLKSSKLELTPEDIEIIEGLSV